MTQSGHFDRKLRDVSYSLSLLIPEVLRAFCLLADDLLAAFFRRQLRGLLMTLWSSSWDVRALSLWHWS